MRQKLVEDGWNECNVENFNETHYTYDLYGRLCWVKTGETVTHRDVVSGSINDRRIEANRSS